MRELAEVGAVAALVASWGMAVLAYPDLPARFPTHFGFSGRPDGWGSKRMLWLLPALSLVQYLFLGWAGTLPGRGLPNPVAYAWLRFEMLGMFWYIEAKSIQVARGRAAGLGAAFLPVTLALILVTSWLLARG